MSTTPRTLEDALEVIDQALAKAEVANLGDLLSNEVSYVASSLGDVNLGPSTVRESLEKASEIASNFDTKVKQNPWPLIAGMALGGFAAGYLLSRSASRTTARSSVRSPPREAAVQVKPEQSEAHYA